MKAKPVKPIAKASQSKSAARPAVKPSVKPSAKPLVKSLVKPLVKPFVKAPAKATAKKAVVTTVKPKVASKVVSRSAPSKTARPAAKNAVKPDAKVKSPVKSSVKKAVKSPARSSIKKPVKGVNTPVPKSGFKVQPAAKPQKSVAKSQTKAAAKAVVKSPIKALVSGRALSKVPAAVVAKTPNKGAVKPQASQVQPAAQVKQGKAAKPEKSNDAKLLQVDKNAALPAISAAAAATAVPKLPLLAANGLPTPPPLKPGRRSSSRALAHMPPPAPMVPTHAPDAAKASYSTMTERVIAPPPHVAAKKDPKLANNWKTKTAETLTEEEVKAMPDAEYMNDVQMAFFRHRLSILKQDIHNSAGATTEHLREDTTVVPDPADRATIEEEHALELRTRDRERKLLKKIEQSIGRIDSGDYGYCDETGEPIGVGRLIARPTASLSLEAQQRRELKQKMFGD